MSLSGPDPDATLCRTLNELRTEFGSGVQISHSLDVKIYNFPSIKSPHQTENLKELLEICQYIDASMNSCTELRKYERVSGFKPLLFKLPENFQNSWRTMCDDYRTNNHGEYPLFPRFVLFLKKKIREFADPLLQKDSVIDNNKKKELSAFKTKELRPFASNSNDSTAPSSSRGVSDPSKHSEVNSSNKKQECPLHQDARHNLVTCRKFSKMPISERHSFLKDNGLCFLCFGKHRRSTCQSNLKCDNCGGLHNTLVHFEYEQTTPANANSNLCSRFCGNPHSTKDCSKVLLVEVSHKSDPKKKLRCYAVVDEQSSSSFL